MEAFEYASPSTVKEALGLLGANFEDASLYGGGTDMLSLLKDNVEETKRLVNTKHIAGLHAIQNERGGIRVGAGVHLDQLISSAEIREHFRAIADGADHISSPQIHNMATVGGWLCQRPRCWYYRNGFGLLALDKDGNSLVARGDNRYHAIFGNSGPAKFISPTSLGPALQALDGRIHIEGPNGARVATAEEFFVIPQKEGEREHALGPREIVTAISIPLSRGLKSAMYEVRQKEGMDWPLTSAAVALRMRGDTVEAARIVMGHVAAKPWPAEEAAKWLSGKTLNEENAAKAGDLAVRGATPLSRNGYKVQLARVTVKRALLSAAGISFAEAKGAA